MALSLEQQIAEVLKRHAVDTLQISAITDTDGTVRFYSVAHGGGYYAYSDLLNQLTVREAIEGGIDALNAKRAAKAHVADLAPMAEAA